MQIDPLPQSDQALDPIWRYLRTRRRVSSPAAGGWTVRVVTGSRRTDPGQGADDIEVAPVQGEDGAGGEAVGQDERGHHEGDLDGVDGAGDVAMSRLASVEQGQQAAGVGDDLA